MAYVSPKCQRGVPYKDIKLNSNNQNLNLCHDEMWNVKKLLVLD